MTWNIENCQLPNLSQNLTNTLYIFLIGVTKVEFFVYNLKYSIMFKVSAHIPKSLDEAYGKAINF